MKKKRHEAILSVITKGAVETQEELAEALRSAGFSVTQATVSRDIRELNLTKMPGEGGRQKYVQIKSGAGTSLDEGLNRIIRATVVSVECAGHLVVIKTTTGMGMAVAVNIDEMKNADILGTIAGDDVVFCAMRDVESGQQLKAFYKDVLENK